MAKLLRGQTRSLFPDDVATFPPARLPARAPPDEVGNSEVVEVGNRPTRTVSAISMTNLCNNQLHETQKGKVSVVPTFHSI